MIQLRVKHHTLVELKAMRKLFKVMREDFSNQFCVTQMNCEVCYFRRLCCDLDQPIKYLEKRIDEIQKGVNQNGDNK